MSLPNLPYFVQRVKRRELSHFHYFSLTFSLVPLNLPTCHLLFFGHLHSQLWNGMTKHTWLVCLRERERKSSSARLTRTLTSSERWPLDDPFSSSSSKLSALDDWILAHFLFYLFFSFHHHHLFNCSFFVVAAVAALGACIFLACKING